MALTYVDIIERGQLQYAQFPNCSSTSAWYTMIGKEIDEAELEVELRVGSTTYASTDANTANRVQIAVRNLTLASLWQQIMNVMVGYDAEALPPEYVDPDKAAAIRDYYLAKYEAVVQVYDETPGDDPVAPEQGRPAYTAPVFLTGGIGDDAEYTQSGIWNWANTNIRPE